MIKCVMIKALEGIGIAGFLPKVALIRFQRFAPSKAKAWRMHSGPPLSVAISPGLPTKKANSVKIVRNVLILQVLVQNCQCWPALARVGKKQLNIRYLCCCVFGNFGPRCSALLPRQFSCRRLGNFVAASGKHLKSII